MTETQEPASLHGWDAPMRDEAERRAAINAAFDYRGDVTLSVTDGRSITGFVSNRDFAGDAPFLELFTTEGFGPQSIALDYIAAIRFTGADPAAGKTWDLWLKKVAHAETEGKIAELYPDDQ